MADEGEILESLETQYRIDVMHDLRNIVLAVVKLFEYAEAEARAAEEIESDDILVDISNMFVTAEIRALLDIKKCDIANHCVRDEIMNLLEEVICDVATLFVVTLTFEEKLNLVEDKLTAELIKKELTGNMIEDSIPEDSVEWISGQCVDEVVSRSNSSSC